MQIYVQNGIFRMLEIFEKEYLTVLKSYNQLETLINFLTKEAAVQTFKPEDTLVSADLLAKQASEVFMAATHTPRSTGYFCHFVLFIDEELKKEAVLQRLTDDVNQSEFMDMGILNSVNDDALQPELCEEGHALSATYGGADSAEVSIKCKACEKSLNSIAKVSQKKTGFMRCAECTSDVNYCNECRPRPQVNFKKGVEITLHTLGVFRVARSEAVFVKSADLLAMSDRTLAMLLTSNIIITEKNDNAPLVDILANLAAKITEDNKWCCAAKCRFILVSAASFTAAANFLQGGKLEAPAADKPKDRGGLITQICKKVTIAKKRL